MAESNISQSGDSKQSSLSLCITPSQTNTSVNNIKAENEVPESEVNAPQISVPHKSVQEKQIEDTLKPMFTNISGNENVNSEVYDVTVRVTGRGPEETVPSTSKRKNGRKKERLKQLHMPQNHPSVQHAHTAPPTLTTVQNEYLLTQKVVSVQELFMTHIGPMYANTSSQYLENLIHHPQYQLMHTMQLREMFQSRPQYVTSAPNTPLVQHPPIYNPGLCLAPLLHPEPSTPRYLQNVMQHPLLNKSYSQENQIFLKQTQKHSNVVQNTEEQSSSPRRRRRARNKAKNKENIDDKRFEQYLTAEEVEVGLKNKTFIEGVVRINPKQFTHAYVSSTDRDEQDILIDGVKNRNRALEGDVVIVELEDDTDDDEPTENVKDNSTDEVRDNSTEVKQKKGKVVFIKNKVHTRTCIGVLKLMSDRNRQKALFTPRDHRVPRLNIPFTCWPDNFYDEAKNYENTLFLAEIIHWSDVRFASGKIICNIGQSGDMMTETKAILAQTDLDITPYGPEVRHLYPRLDYTIPEAEIQLREDCRKLCIFSIDPSNCRDIDDAVSCKKLANGNYEIGVHISDVAHFLTEGTVLDEKVAEKATTIYLVEKAYHMLPDELCMLCSLFPGVDKLAFSVFWEITEDADVVSHRFSKTIIHSCCQLAYDHAQAILEDKVGSKEAFPETYNGYGYEDIYDTIKVLGKVSAIFRKRRFSGGALRIDQPKVSFHLSPANGLPESYRIYESQESHQLIEEFMLLANMTVANRINEDHPKLAFLRSHPPPSGFMLRQLAKALKPMGIELDITSAGSIHQSLLTYEGPDEKDRARSMVLNMLCAKPMARARYFCAFGCDDDDFHHYALNVPLYTHFTSPIRRYADIMVHRLLAASLNYREMPTWEVDKVRKVAAQCNKQKYNSKKAGELSTELYTLKYIELNSPLITEGVVVEVREKYIDVIIIAIGLNRRIFFNSDFPGEFKCVKNDAGSKLSKMEVTWRATETLPEVKQVIEVFSILKIEMHKGDDMVKVETKVGRP